MAGTCRRHGPPGNPRRPFREVWYLHGLWKDDPGATRTRDLRIRNAVAGVASGEQGRQDGPISGHGESAGSAPTGGVGSRHGSRQSPATFLTRSLKYRGVAVIKRRRSARIASAFRIVANAPDTRPAHRCASSATSRSKVESVSCPLDKQSAGHRPQLAESGGAGVAVS
jgi:hypothetical protein